MKIACVLLITPVCWLAIAMSAIGYNICQRGVRISAWATTTMQDIAK